jgi:hypothetical protein
MRNTLKTTFLDVIDFEACSQAGAWEQAEQFLKYCIQVSSQHLTNYSKKSVKYCNATHLSPYLFGCR